MKLTKKSTCLIATAVLALFSTAAQAVETYGNIATPVIFGGGNVNGNFTIDTTNGVELALRAKNYGGATIDGSSGVYHTAPGIVPGRPANSPRALWNYEFAINTGSGALGDYIFRLGVDNDASSGVNYTFVNPISYFSGNGMSGDNVVQGSQNIIFASTPGGLIDTGVPFNVFSAGTYDFILLAFNAGTTDLSIGNAVSSVNAVVQVPEPAPFALLGLGALGLLAARRRRL